MNIVDTLKNKYRNLISDKKFSEILVGSAFALTARVAAAGLTLITSIIITRIYGAEAMGVLALINSFLFLVTIFTVFGTGSSILRLIPEFIVKHSIASAFFVYRKTQYLVASISVATGTIFYFASKIVADKIFNKPQLSFLFALAAGFVVFKSLADLNTQAVRGLRLIGTYALMQVIPALTMLVLLVAVTLFYPHPNNPVYTQLAAYSVTAVAGAWIMNHAFKSKIQPGDSLQPMPIREILSISTPMFMTASMYFIGAQAGVILLGMFRTASEVGYYSVAAKLATLTAFVLQAINSMAAPKFSELYHSGKMDELFHVAKKSTKLIFWTTVPVLMVLVIFGKPILGLMFGDEFRIAYPAMVMMVIGQFVSSISGSTGFFMNMTGHQIVLRNIIAISSVINVALNIILIPFYGINGSAFAGMASLVFWNIYSLIYIKQKYGRTIGYLPVVI